VQQSLAEVEEATASEQDIDQEVLTETYQELMAANKDLIELYDEVEAMTHGMYPQFEEQEVSELKGTMLSNGSSDKLKQSLMH